MLCMIMFYCSEACILIFYVFAINNNLTSSLQGIEYMNLDHEKWSDVNVISSLLKSFFRQLPEALVTDGKLVKCSPCLNE